MKTIMSKSPHDSSFSFSRRYLHWKKKPDSDDQDPDDGHLALTRDKDEFTIRRTVSADPPRKKPSVVSVSKIRSALTGLGMTRSHQGRIVGTLFGRRRGHVHFAVQQEPSSAPVFLIELAIPTGVLVREMASGVARIALECERNAEKKKKGKKLVEETIWRTYCNGMKYGSANGFECGDEERRVLRAIGAVTVGAGVLPAERRENGGGSEEEDGGEVMYMRARFERVVGSRDSEAFYMMNPDGAGGPELSIFLIRV